MSVPYHDIIAAAALRTNGLIGPKQASLETTYNTRPLTVANFNSSIFPFSDYVMQTASAEEKLAQTIADVRDHPWRASLLSQTAALANRAVVPAVDASGVPIIGVYGSVYDATDNRALFKQPAEVIERRLATPSIWKIPVYHYDLSGDTVLHTRTTVKIEVCVYDYATQLAAIEANGNMLLPDVLAEALICGVVALMVRDDEFLQQAEVYATYFSTVLAAIKGGAIELPVKEAA